MVLDDDDDEDEEENVRSRAPSRCGLAPAGEDEIEGEVGDVDVRRR